MEGNFVYPQGAPKIKVLFTFIINYILHRIKPVKIIIIPYRYIRILSLDILAGALSGTFYAARIFHAHLPVVYWIVLPSTIWIIYLLDHILDGIKYNGIIKNEKYAFYSKHKKALLLLLSFLSAITFFQLYFLIGTPLLWLGLSLLPLLILYFFLHHFIPQKNKYFLHKELIISIVYTTGIFGGPLIYSRNLNGWYLIIAASYFLLVLTNVFVYSYFEFSIDKELGVRSFATGYGPESARQATRILSLFSAILAIVLVISSPFLTVGTVHFGITLMLASIPVFPEKFRRNGFYGILADGVFILPGIVVWLQGLF